MPSPYKTVSLICSIVLSSRLRPKTMNNSTLLQEELISAFTQGFVYAWGLAATTVVLTDSHAGNSQTGWESPPLVCFSSYISQAISQSPLIHILPVLYVYDFILTLPLEVSEIWSSKFSGATLAYLLNRYGTLWFFVINVLASLAPISDVSVRTPYFLLEYIYLLNSFSYRCECMLHSHIHWKI